MVQFEIQTVVLSTIHGTIYTSSRFTASGISARGIGVDDDRYLWQIGNRIRWSGGRCLWQIRNQLRWSTIVSKRQRSDGWKRDMNIIPRCRRESIGKCAKLIRSERYAMWLLVYRRDRAICCRGARSLGRFRGGYTWGHVSLELGGCTMRAREIKSVWQRRWSIGRWEHRKLIER